MASPLANLQQQVYDIRGGVNVRYLSPGEPIPRLWTSQEVPVDTDTAAQQIAEAIRAGMLSVQHTPDNGLKLHVHVNGARVSQDLTRAEPSQHIDRLLDAAFTLVRRPEEGTSQNNARLTAQLEEKDAEITSLNNKVLNLKATIQRHTGSAGRKDVQSSPVKQAPPPANASKLQPNQKRRKLVETEFAGSDEDSDDDDDDESEEEYDE